MKKNIRSAENALNFVSIMHLPYYLLM
jgi:hypothetical protein